MSEEGESKGKLLKGIVRELAILNSKSTKLEQEEFITSITDLIHQIIENFEKDEYDRKMLGTIESWIDELRSEDDKTTNWAFIKMINQNCMILIHPLRQKYLGVQ